MDGWIDEWLDGMMVSGWMDSWLAVEERMQGKGGLMEWMGGRMDEWFDGRMDLHNTFLATSITFSKASSTDWIKATLLLK